MRNLSVQSALVYSGFLALSACTATEPQYETITSTAAVTSSLAGSAIRVDTLGNVILTASVADMNGSVTHDTGRISITDGTYLLVDPDGFDINGIVTDGSVSGQRLDGAGSGLFARVYDYVIPFEYSYPSGGQTIAVGGTAGIATRAADVPNRGAAQYSGEAFTRIVSPDGSTDFFLKNGISIVDVDFAAGSVDVTMGFYTDIVQAGTVTTVPIDAVSGTGMTIVGARFVGGTWVTLKNGFVVGATGAGTTIQAGGEFYGYDPTISAPDEVAGVVLMDGNSAMVYSIFIAD